MKCLVAIKSVMDFNAKIRLTRDKSKIDNEHVRTIINPFDEIAIEEAVRLKETGIVSEVVIVSIDSNAASEILRTSLARGGDRAVLVTTDRVLEPINIAKILMAIVAREGATLVIMGKQAIDNDCNQTGQMLAGLLNWSQGTYVSKLKVKAEEQSVEVTREVDEGLEDLNLKLPAVITVDLRLNQPRYISLPNVVQAKRKKIEIIPLVEINLDLKEHVRLLKVELPEKQRLGIKVSSAKELIDKLKNEAKVI